MAEDECSSLDLVGFEKQLQHLFTNGCSNHALQVDGKTFCSEFCKLVEEYTCHWQAPLPQLRILEIALRHCDREFYLFPVGCDDVHHMLSSLALSVFELLLFFDKNDFEQDPLKQFTVTFQESQSLRHQNVHLLEVSNCLQDGGPWGNVTLQSILTQSTTPQNEVDQYIGAQLPVLLELRVRYLLTCERVSEAMALARCCSQHPTAGEHPFFLQVYLTWLHKTSQSDLLNTELANLNGKDALHVICNMENEEEDESLLALTRAFLSQELRRGDMDHLCDLVFIWSKLHMRLKTSKDVLLEESGELMLSATNVNAIFPFIRVILEELGDDGLQFCVELCTKALQSCDDISTKSLIYKTIAGLFPNDLEICRACALLVYFLEPTVEAYKMVLRLYTQPDQEYNADDSPVSNQVRFELFQVLKKHMHFDPEFCDLTALRDNCKNLMSETAESAALEEILEWVPDLHLSIYSSNLQQRTEVSQQVGPKKHQTKDYKKNHMTSEQRRARTDDHTRMTKGKPAVNETPALDSLWHSSWQLDKMYHSLIPLQLSEKKCPRQKIRKLQRIVEYSETTEVLDKESTSLETASLHTKIKPAVVILPRLPQINKASTSLLVKMKFAVVVLDRLPQTDTHSSSLLSKIKPSVVVLDRLPSTNKASSSLFAKIKPAVVNLSRLPQINKASTLLLVKMKLAVVVLDRLPQIDTHSSSLLSKMKPAVVVLHQLHESEAGSTSSSQRLPAVVVLPEHSSQTAAQCVSEDDDDDDAVSIDSDTCWEPINRRHHSKTPLRSSEFSQTHPFSCPECLYAFTSQDFLHKHMKRSHSDLQPFCCKRCPKSFTSQSNLRQHERIHTRKKSYQCTQCSKAFSGMNSLEIHLRVHTGEKPFCCKRCPKSFTSQSNLRQHERIHTGKKSYQCTQCSKAFSRMDSLEIHLHVYTGEKPFCCKRCPKSFTSQCNLRQHERIHTGKKSYQCTQCSKAFSRMDSLKIHMRVHTGEKPFRCKQCDKSFRQLGLLKTHQRLHTGEKPFKCKRCDLSFNEAGNLKKHYLKRHVCTKTFDKATPELPLSRACPH